MTLDFVFDSLPGRVVFAAGGAGPCLGAEIERLGAQRIMLVTTPGSVASPAA